MSESEWTTKQVAQCMKRLEDMEAILMLSELKARLEADAHRGEDMEAELAAGLRDMVKAMALWGSWEDGIPEAGDDAHGSVGYAFDNACDVLGLDCSSASTFQDIQHALRVRGEGVT